MLGLRSARAEFRHGSSLATVTLYPMVHIGDSTFYDESFREAFEHDVVLVEGIKSPVGRHLTRSYRWIDFKKLGLVLQPKKPQQSEIRGRIVKADLSTEEFHREWQKVPIGYRALFYLLSPLVGMQRRFFGSRESLAKNMSLDDLPSSDEILDWNPKFEPINHSLIRARDQRLIECLNMELDNDRNKRIAVIYGARHMRAVIRELTSRRFYCSDTRWRTIFSL